MHVDRGRYLKLGGQIGLMTNGGGRAVGFGVGNFMCKMGYLGKIALRFDSKMQFEPNFWLQMVL